MVNQTIAGSVITVVGSAVVLLLAGILVLMAVFGKRLRQTERRAYTDQMTGGLNNIGLSKRSVKYLNEKNLQHAVVLMEVGNYGQMVQTFGYGKTGQGMKYL